mgnify:CR=1 FL=1
MAKAAVRGVRMASLASVASIAGAAGSICDSCRSFLVLLPVTVPFWLSLPAFVTRNAVLRLQNADAIADLRGWNGRLRGWFRWLRGWSGLVCQVSTRRWNVGFPTVSRFVMPVGLRVCGFSCKFISCCSARRPGSLSLGRSAGAVSYTHLTLPTKA